MLTDRIKTVKAIDDANLILIYPDKELLNSPQEPITAILIITQKPGRDVLNNRKTIKSIQRILKIAVPCLDDENIIIVDRYGSMIGGPLEINDFKRNINGLIRALVLMITDHIKTINGIDDANLILIYPDKENINLSKKPITACVIITPKPGSDVFNNRKKIEGIQGLLKIPFQELDDENIIIVDWYGSIINDFN